MEDIKKVLTKYFSDGNIYSITKNQIESNYHGFGSIELIKIEETIFANCSLPNGAYNNFNSLCEELNIVKDHIFYSRRYNLRELLDL